MEACSVCQTEKTGHTLARGSPQSSQTPSQKWQYVSLDFVTDFPDMGDGVYAIMAVIDKAIRMVYLIYCSKPIYAEQTAKLYLRYVTKLHGIPSNIYSDRSTQFVSKYWSPLWDLFGQGLFPHSLSSPDSGECCCRTDALMHCT